MESNRFVIVDTSKGLYFAKNQKNRLTKDSDKVSWWTDEKDARKTLNRIAKKPAIKEKVGKLTVMKLQDAKKKIAQNANQLTISSVPYWPQAPYWQQAEHLVQLVSSISNVSLAKSERLGCVSQLKEELIRLTTNHDLDDLTAIYRDTTSNNGVDLGYDPDAIIRFVRRFVYTYPEPIAEESIVDDQKPIVEELIINDTGEPEQVKLFNHLKLVCLTVAKFQQEELSYAQKSFCMLAAAFNEQKSSIAKKIRECDNKDLDFLHVIELGKFDAVKWAKLITFERENRQKRRQYKDEWLAIDTLFPNPEPDMTKIKSQAEKCLETIELVEGNNRKYTFRDKESKKRFGNLLK